MYLIWLDRKNHAAAKKFLFGLKLFVSYNFIIPIMINSINLGLANTFVMRGEFSPTDTSEDFILNRSCFIPSKYLKSVITNQKIKEIINREEK